MHSERLDPVPFQFRVYLHRFAASFAGSVAPPTRVPDPVTLKGIRSLLAVTVTVKLNDPVVLANAPLPDANDAVPVTVLDKAPPRVPVPVAVSVSLFAKLNTKMKILVHCPVGISMTVTVAVPNGLRVPVPLPTAFVSPVPLKESEIAVVV
jgi:hypothetical protein